MSLFVASCTATARRAIGVQAPLSLRSYASSSKSVATAATPTPAASSAQSPSTSSSSSGASSSKSSTPMPGLQLLKDKPDLIALPDSDYPPWLWDLLSDPAMKTTHASVEGGPGILGGGASDATLEESAAGGGGVGSKGTTTKGEARIKQKQEMRERRQAFAAAQAAKKKGVAMGNVSAEEVAAQMAEGAVQGGDAVAEERKKRELRRKNREGIKARNFLGR